MSIDLQTTVQQYEKIFARIQEILDDRLKPGMPFDVQNLARDLGKIDCCLTEAHLAEVSRVEIDPLPERKTA